MCGAGAQGWERAPAVGAQTLGRLEGVGVSLGFRVEQPLRQHYAARAQVWLPAAGTLS